MSYICDNTNQPNNMEIFKNSPDFTASLLQLLNDTEAEYFKGIEQVVESFLKQTVSIKRGDVVDIAAQPKQYFSRARRFVIFAIRGTVGRDEKSGKMVQIMPQALGVFLDDKGNAVQPPVDEQFAALAEGSYYFETIDLTGKNQKSFITKLAEDQAHNVQITL